MPLFIQLLKYQMRKTLLLSLSLIFIAFASSSFTAGPKRPMIKLSKECIANLDFELINKTGYTIKDIYIAPTTEREWGDDIMGRDLLKHNESVDIVFDAGEVVTKWDIYVTWDGYESDEDVFWIGFDLSTISQITLFYNEKTGKTWAEYK